MPAVDRGELLHEAADRIKARTDELAEAMTLEGGKPLIENSDEVSWVMACFDYYAEIGRDSAGRVIPSIESTQLAMVLKEPHGVWGLHRALELPAAAAGVEAGAGARGRERDRLQALRGDAALDPDALAAASTTCRPASSTSSPARARSAPRSPPTRASTASPSPDPSRRARRSVTPAWTASPGSTSRWAARTPSSSARTSRTRSTSPRKGGAWAAFLNAGQVCTSAERFYVTPTSTTTTCRRSRTSPTAS